MAVDERKTDIELNGILPAANDNARIVRQQAFSDALDIISYKVQTYLDLDRLFRELAGRALTPKARKTYQASLTALHRSHKCKPKKQGRPLSNDSDLITRVLELRQRRVPLGEAINLIMDEEKIDDTARKAVRQRLKRKIDAIR